MEITILPWHIVAALQLLCVFVAGLLVTFSDRGLNSEGAIILLIAAAVWIAPVVITGLWS